MSLLQQFNLLDLLSDEARNRMSSKETYWIRRYGMEENIPGYECDQGLDIRCNLERYL